MELVIRNLTRMRPVCALLPVSEARHGGLAVLLPGSGGSFTGAKEVIHNLTHCAFS